MKKLLTVLLGVLMVLALVGCGAKKEETPVVDEDEPVEEVVTAANTFADYEAAEIDAELELLMSVQCAYIDYKGNGFVFLQCDEGATLGYCDGADTELFAKMTPGTLVKVHGYKSEWSGELELGDATYEIVGEGTNYEALDVTDLCGDIEGLTPAMNEKVSFKALQVKEYKYNWDGSGQRDSSDIYLDVECPNNADMTFVIKTGMYDCNSELFQFVETLESGDLVDIEAFMYWYEGPQPYINAIAKVAE